MPIKAEFVLTVVNVEQAPKDHLPEIAMLGRSNVGKSSLINRLLGVARLAHTSNTPGRTQALNYYRIHPNGKPDRSSFYLVDMPGYGFAQVSSARRAQWGALVRRYIDTRETLCGLIQLIDLRHPPQPLDLEVNAWLRDEAHHLLVVGTKADKIAKTKVPEAMLQVAEDLDIDSESTQAFSALTGLGRDQVWRWILDTVGECK